MTANLTEDVVVERRALHAVLGPRGARRVVLPVAGVITLLAIWHAAVAIYDISRLILPTPWSVAERLVKLLGEGDFWHNVWVSVFEFATGFGIGGVLGVAIGLAMAELTRFRMTLHPVIQAFRFIVPFAWISLTVLWFGTSYWGKIFLVAYAVFFVMVISTAESVRHVDPTLSRVATVLGMGRFRRAFVVHLRAASPSIASAARAAAAIGWIAVVAAEYVGSNAGLGYLIINAVTSVETATVIAGMIVIGVVGAGISAGINWLSRRRLSYDV